MSANSSPSLPTAHRLLASSLQTPAHHPQQLTQHPSCHPGVSTALVTTTFVPNRLCESVVCLNLNGEKTYIGWSGPGATPTHLKSVDTGFKRGVISDWAAIKTVLVRAYEHLRVAKDTPSGTILVLPPKFTTSEAERLIEVLFTECPVHTIVLVNPWIAVLMSANKRTGVVVFIEEYNTCVAAVIDMKVEPSSIGYINSGSKHASEPPRPSELTYAEEIHAVCSLVWFECLKARC